MKPAILLALTAATIAACSPSEPREAEVRTPAQAAAPDLAGPLPPPPAWAGDYIGKVLTDVLPERRDCVGNTDGLRQRYRGPPAGVTVSGWGWDNTQGRRIERILLADESLRIVGAGQGGKPRPDVPSAAPQVKDPNAGWEGSAPITSGDVVAYGLIDNGRALCPLGWILV